MPEVEEHDHSCCSGCCPVEGCDYEEEEDYDYYEPDDEEGDLPMTNWTEGLEDDNDFEGEWIRTTRTVGVEFERASYGNAYLWQNNIPRGVGIGSDHCGPELRTPPLKGQAADRINQRTLVALIEGGTRAGEEAGLHVHVHFPEGMQGDYWYANRRYNYNTGLYEHNTLPDSEARATAFARLYALWHAVEHITYRFDPSRRRNSYSEQFTRNRASRIDVVNEALEAAADGRLPNVQTGRYNSLNVSGGYGTVEFRNHGSTDDVPHVMAWIAFVQGMVDLSQKLSFITIRRLAYAKTHDERARLLMQAAKRHGVFTPTAYAAIRQALGLSAARTRDLPARRAA